MLEILLTQDSILNYGLQCQICWVKKDAKILKYFYIVGVSTLVRYLNRFVPVWDTSECQRVGQIRIIQNIYIRSYNVLVYEKSVLKKMPTIASDIW